MDILKNLIKPEVGLVSDIGRVIIDYDPLEICNAIRQKLGLEQGEGISDEEMRGLLFESKQYHDFESGWMFDEDFFKYISNSVRGLRKKEFSIMDFIEAWNSGFSANEGVMGIYQRAIDAGYPFIQLTDANPVHFNHIIRNFPFVATKQYVLSYHVHALKPAKIMYGVAAGRIRMFPDKCVYVDDKAANAQGALDAGYKAAFQYTGDNAGLEDFLKGYGFRI